MLSATWQPCCLDINVLTASHIQVMIHCLSSTHRGQGTHIYVVKQVNVGNVSFLSPLNDIQIIWNDLYYCHYSLPNFFKHRLMFWIQITEHAWMHCKAKDLKRAAVTYRISQVNIYRTSIYLYLTGEVNPNAPEVGQWGPAERVPWSYWPGQLQNTEINTTVRAFQTKHLFWSRMSHCAGPAINAFRITTRARLPSMSWRQMASIMIHKIIIVKQL